MTVDETVGLIVAMIRKRGIMVSIGVGMIIDIIYNSRYSRDRSKYISRYDCKYNVIVCIIRIIVGTIGIICIIVSKYNSR